MTEALAIKPSILDISVDTMVEKVRPSEAALVAGKNGLLAPVDIINGDRTVHTELICVKQQKGGISDDDIRTDLVHFMPNQNQTGWNEFDLELPRLIDWSVNDNVLSGVKELVAFHQAGITYLLVLYGSLKSDQTQHVQLMWCEYVDGRPIWKDYTGGDTGSTLLGAISKVRDITVLRTHDGEHIIYGVSRNMGDPEAGQGQEGFYLFRPVSIASNLNGSEPKFETALQLDPDISGWTNQSEAVSYKIGPSNHAVYPGEFAFNFIRFQNGQISFDELTVSPPEPECEDDAIALYWDNEEQRRLDTHAVDLSSSTVESLQFPDSEDSVLLVHQPSGDLCLLSGTSEQEPTLRVLTGPGEDGPRRVKDYVFGQVDVSSNTDIAEGLPTKSFIAIFARDMDTGHVWLARLTSPTATLNWSRVSGAITALDCPRFMTGCLEFFTVSTDEASQITHHTQSLADGQWFKEKVKSETQNDSQLEDKAAHVFDISVSGLMDASPGNTDEADTANQPVPCMLEPVDIFCEVPTLIYMDGHPHRVGPNIPLKKNTDISGRIRAVLQTESIGSPSFTVITSTGEKKRFSPNGRIAQRLHGTAKGYNAANDLSKEVPPEHRKTVQTLVKRVGQTISQAQAGADKPKKEREGGITQINAEGVKPYNALSFENLFAQAKNIPVLGDIINFVETAAKFVSDIFVRIKNSIVEFVVKIGDELHKFAVKAYETIVDAMESVVAFLGHVFSEFGKSIVELGKSLLKAVSFLLGGEDVFRLNDAMKASALGTIRMTTSAFRSGADVSSRATRHLINKLDGELDKVFTFFETGADHLEVGKSVSVNIGGVEVSPNFIQSQRASADIAGSSTMQNGQAVANQDISLSESIKTRLDDFVKQIKTRHETELKPVLEGLLGKPESLSSTDPILSLLKAPLKTLRTIKLILRVMLLGVVDLINMAIQIFIDLVEALLNYLDRPIDVPLLGDLVRAWSGDPKRGVSLLDCITLPAAFVGTVIYKILFWKAPVSETDFEGLKSHLCGLTKSADLSKFPLSSKEVSEEIAHNESISTFATSEHNYLTSTNKQDMESFEQNLSEDNEVESNWYDPASAKAADYVINIITALLTLFKVISSPKDILLKVKSYAALLGKVPGNALFTIFNIIAKFETVIDIIIKTLKFLTTNIVKALTGCNPVTGRPLSKISRTFAWIFFGLGCVIVACAILFIAFCGGIAIVLLLQVPNEVWAGLNLAIGFVMLHVSIIFALIAAYSLIERRVKFNEFSWGQNTRVIGSLITSLMESIVIFGHYVASTIAVAIIFTPIKIGAVLMAISTFVYSLFHKFQQFIRLLKIALIVISNQDIERLLSSLMKKKASA